MFELRRSPTGTDIEGEKNGNIQKGRERLLHPSIKNSLTESNESGQQDRDNQQQTGKLCVALLVIVGTSQGMCSCLQTVPEVAELQLGDGTIVRVAAGGITVRVVWVEVDGVGPVVSDKEIERKGRNHS